MDLFKNRPESGLAPRLAGGPAGSTRRTFLRSLVGGVGIAIPAFGALVAAAPPALAVNPCSSVRVHLVTQWCSAGGSGCPVGNAGTCTQEWQRTSTITGQSCGVFYTNVGPCGTNSCPGGSANAPAVC